MTPEDLVHHSSIDKYLTTPVPIDFAAEAKIASDRVTAKAQTQQSDPSQAIHVSSYETSLKAARERVARMTEEEKTQANLAIEELALGLLSVALIDNPSPVYEVCDSIAGHHVDLPIYLESMFTLLVTLSPHDSYPSS